MKFLCSESDYSLEMWKYLNFINLFSKLVPGYHYLVSWRSVPLRGLDLLNLEVVGIRDRSEV